MTTPLSLDAKVDTEVKAAKSWLLLHERLIIVVLTILSLLFVGNKVLTHQADKDRQAATVAQQALSIQAEQNKSLAAEVAQTQQSLAALVVQVGQQNSALAAASQQRTVVLQQQQAADRTLPMPDLGNRWATLAKLQPTDLTANDQGLEVSPDAARATVTQLETIPTLQANLTAEQLTAANLQKVIDSSTNLNTQLTNEVSGLKVQLTDQVKACTTEVTAVKAEARKGKLHWFEAGVVVGFVGREAIRFYTGK